jgi:N-dimethylarginine dimethylaminohydrolase
MGRGRQEDDDIATNGTPERLGELENGLQSYATRFQEVNSEYRLGLPLHELDTSEARKMDGALTCLSLRF